MGKITKNSSVVTSGDAKNYPNRKSAHETNTPLDPFTSGSSAHFTTDPQGNENRDLKSK